MINALTSLAATAVILSKDEQSLHVAAYQASGDKRALKALIRSNVRLAHKVAKKNIRRGVEFNDLLASAVEGIIIAAGKFDPSKGASFTTYSRQWMVAKCQEYVQANAGMVHVGSRTSKRLWAGLQKARKAIGQDATPEAIAEHMGLDVDEVRECMTFMTARGTSLDAPISEDGGTVATLIGDDSMRQDEVMERTQNSERILCAVSEFADTLNDRQREVLTGRIVHELVGTEKRDATTFGVSKQRVGQIEKDLTRRLASFLTRSIGQDGVRAMITAAQ